MSRVATMIRVAVVTASLFGLATCGSNRSTTPAPTTKGKIGSIVVDTDRFPHGVHTGDKPEIRNYEGRRRARGLHNF